VRPEPRRRPGSAHLWLLLPAAALAALWLAWRCLAAVDFFYPVFYQALDIHGHIQEFGPQNRYKSGFEHTTREERFRVFGAVVDAIHADGAGLAEITYHGPDGRPVDRMFRAPEVGHLQDVAHLVSRIAPVGWLAVAWVGLHLALIRLRRWRVPPLGRLLGASLLATAVATLAVLLAGPRRLFQWFHEVAFPPDHPWFFYYQDSLMSTFMKAPDLFGAIAVALVVLGLVFYALLLWGASRLAPQPA
jgi:hypothetical protein